MTATNHALAGALIGLTVGNPVLAIPAAFVSHFVLDAIPHYDQPGEELARYRSNRFRNELLAHALLCFLLVVLLAITRPTHWLTAALCAFVATSPDLFWIPKFVAAKRHSQLLKNRTRFWRFHDWIQWRTGPELLWVEIVWFLVVGFVLVTRL